MGDLKVTETAASRTARHLPERDIRAPRRPLAALVLRFDTLRVAARVGTLAVLDAFGISAAIYTALWIKAVTIAPGAERYVGAQTADYAPLACLVAMLLFARSGLYRERAQRPGLARVGSSLFQATVVILIYALIEGHRFRSYYIFYASLAFALLYVGVLRWAFERASGAILRAAGFRRRALLVGRAGHVERVAEALRESSEIEPFGYIVSGFYENNGEPASGNGADAHGDAPALAGNGSFAGKGFHPRRLRDFGSLETVERNLDSVDEVLICDPEFPGDRAVELVERCHRAGVRVRVAPSTLEILMDRVEFVPGQAIPLFELRPPVFEGFDFVVKRTFDIVGAALLVVALSPLMALIALAIKLTSRGPVLYRSLRPGIGGRPFYCLKFRTMIDGAEDLQDVLEDANEKDGAIFKIRDDPRITAIGRVLRRWSLDELPQLFNVLRGEMSLVGPRPLPMRDYLRLEDWHRKRYLVLPGITGLWQVSGRSELDFDELVRLDFLYLERWSVWLDLAILIRTVPAVLRARGAW